MIVGTRLRLASAVLGVAFLLQAGASAAETPEPFRVVLPSESGYEDLRVTGLTPASPAGNLFVGTGELWGDGGSVDLFATARVRRKGQELQYALTTTKGASHRVRATFTVDVASQTVGRLRLAVTTTAGARLRFETPEPLVLEPIPEDEDPLEPVEFAGELVASDPPGYGGATDDSLAYVYRGVPFHGECVASVRRYYQAIYGITTPLLGEFGNMGAWNLWDNAPTPGMLKIPRTGTNTPQPDDMVVWMPWTGNEFGHVAVVSEGISPTEARVVHSNWSGRYKGSEDLVALDARVYGWYRPSNSAGGFYGINFIERVSSADHTYGAFRPSLSHDGRFVAYQGELLSGSNDVYDILVADRASGSRRRASVTWPASVGGNSESARPSISGDGQVVAFASSASDLGLGDANGVPDVFVQEWLGTLGLVRCLSRTPLGISGDAASDTPSVSSNGRFVAFMSGATNLGAPAGAGTPRVYRHDPTTGVLVNVSRTPGGAGPDGNCTAPSISADGRLVAYMSSATDLVAGDTNGRTDVFVWDASSGVTTRVSVTSAGAQGTEQALQCALAGQGRYVAFASASFLGSEVNDGFFDSDIFVRDLAAGTTTFVSGVPAGPDPNAECFDPGISADGRYVVFRSAATNLGAVGTGGKQQVYVRDMVAGTMAIASAGLSGPANNDCFWPVISGDGRTIAFQSPATNLVTGDTNGSTDVFLVRNPLLP
jgi:Tol biopolymer transport system component